MRKNYVLLAAVLTVLFLAAMPALAAVGIQDQAEVDWPFSGILDPAVILAIQTLLAGGVYGLTQLLKIGFEKIFGSTASGWRGYAFSFILSAIGTAITLYQFESLAVFPLAAYTVYTWGVSNGWWKAIKAQVKDKL